MSDLDLKATIELLIKGGQLPTEVGNKLKTLAANAEAAKASTDRFSKATTSLNSALGAVGITLGAAAIINFAKTSYIEFAKTERIYRSVETQLRALGDAAGFTSDEMRKLITATSEQYGILDDDLVPAFNRLLIAFGNGKAAAEALQISSQFAANGLGTVQGNAEALAVAFQTGILRGLKQFGIQTKDAAGDAVTLSEGLELIRAKQATLNTTMDDAQSRLDKIAIAWDTIKDRVGEVVDTLLSIPEAAKNAINYLNPWADKPLPAVYDLVRDRPDPTQPAGPASALGGLFSDKDAKVRAEKEVAAAKDRNQKLAELDKAAAEERQALWDKQMALRLANEELFANIRAENEADDIQREQDRLAVVAEAEQRLLDFRIEMAQKAADDLREVDAQAFIAADDMLVGLLIQRLEREYLVEIAAANKLGADTTKITELYEKKKSAIRQGHAAQDVKVTAALEQNKRLMAWQTVAMLGNALSMAFSKNKSLAIATAIIDTIAGAQAAFAQTPGPVWVKAAAAALAASMGFARVQQIKSTNLGSDSGSAGVAGSESSGTPSAASSGSTGQRQGYIGGQSVENVSPSSAAASSSSVAIDLRGSQFASRRDMRKFVRKIRRAVPGADALNIR